MGEIAETSEGNPFLMFAKRWAICFMLATGFTLLSVSSVRLAVLILQLLGMLWGRTGFDEAVHSFC